VYRRFKIILKISALPLFCALASTLQKESAAATARPLQSKETTMLEFLFWSL
jgi:hypothetical protein